MLKDVAIQKKLELKDELTKYLATKADILLLKAEIEAKLEKEVLRVEKEVMNLEIRILELEAMALKLDKKFTIMSLILLFAIVFLNREALEFLAKLLGLIR